MTTHSIGKTIKTLRNQHKVTQYELGQAIGVSMQAVSKWECGGAPDIDILPAIADFFNISIDELFGRKTNEGKNLGIDLYYDLMHTPDSNKFEKACAYCWNIIKGISNIQGIEDYEFCNIPYTEECTRSRMIDDTGIAWMSCTDELHMICLAPEPKHGFDSMMGSTSEYLHLFKILSDEDCLKLLFFLYTRSDSLFSDEYASEKTKIPLERIKEVFEIFERERWIIQETVDTNSSNSTFFRPLHKEVFIFFMYFAKEMLFTQRLWYLSNSRRKMPIFRCNAK